MRFQTGSIRRCHRATPASGAPPCSRNSAVPPGFSTRRISASTAAWSATEQRVKVVTTESGGASCRERVCQYVSISVVAVSYKKKNKVKRVKQPINEKRERRT